MSYIGQGLPADTFQGFTTDSFTGDGSATTFTLSKEPFSEDTLIVVINNVIQKPTTNFTVSGTTLTIVGTAVASGDVIYAIHMGGPLPIGGAAELDLNGASDKLILDADADTTISADTDDQIDFKVGGTDEMTLSSTGLVINEGSNDRDVRIETNSSTHGLFVDGGNNVVGIGAASPSTTFRTSIYGDGSSIIGGIEFRNAASGGETFTIGHAGADSTSGKLNVVGAGVLRFDTNNTERARITSSGQFLVGATSSSRFFNIESDLNAQYALHIEHTQAAPYGIFLQYTGAAPDSTNDNYFIYCADTGTARFYVTGDGDTYNHDDAFNGISDERVKQDITDASSQWDDIKALKIRSFRKKDDVRAYGDDAKTQIGVIAQEAELVCPKLVTEVKPSPADVISSSEFGTLYEDGDELPVDTKVGDVKEVKDHVKGFKYSILHMKAVKALQEAMAKIETLETKVKALEDA